MKIKKRNKLLSVCLVLVLAACAMIGGVLATEAIANNAISSNDVMSSTQAQQSDVVLVRQQRAYNQENNQTELVPYVDGTMLYPLVGSAQYNGNNFDEYGMPTAEGYVDQIVRMQNVSSKPIYVRLIVAIPAALESVDGNASKNALHWNVGNRFMPDRSFSKQNATNNAYANYRMTQREETAMVNGVECNIYIFTYEEPLEAKAITPAAAFVGFYLDKDVNVKNGRVYLDGIDTGYQSDTVKIAVKAQAVQAEGWQDENDNGSNKDEALGALSNMSSNPWDTTVNPIATNNQQ